MDATHTSKDKIIISFRPSEIAFLANAINETLEAVEDWEFQTRTGETRKRATEIQTQLQKLLDDSHMAGE
jgi:hypothetical protein